MNSLRNIVVLWRGALALVCGLMLLTGCETLTPNQDKAEEVQDLNPDIIRIGERLDIEFLDINPTQKIEQVVQQDGTIGLILGQSYKIGGKTVTQAQNEIRDLYVSKSLFYRVTVNIKREIRYVSVGGEVKKPGPQPYLGKTTVVMAIQAAGDFTVYANKKKVQLTRSNGKTFTINVNEAIKDPKKDPLIFPGDKIHVPLAPY